MENQPGPHPRSWTSAACLLGGSAALVAFGYAVGALSVHGEQEPVESEIRRPSAYAFINPLLECDAAGNLSVEFRPSRQAVEQVIDAHKQAKDVTDVAVYFRDLNNGPWFGIQEKMPFAASSMLKVAHLMAVYKHAEDDPTLLKRAVAYTHAYHTEPQTIQASEQLRVGTTYTVEELVRRLIVYSDNEALYLLQDKVPEADAEPVYKDLGIDFTVSNEISVRNYSSLFRILFNASYLDRAWSERALKLISEVEYKGGLRKGVPSSIPVAHKFGERALANPLSQLHDCGIVYYPARPYLLCVMTRGTDMGRMEATIAHVSGVVYEDIRGRFGSQ